MLSAVWSRGTNLCTFRKSALLASTGGTLNFSQYTCKWEKRFWYGNLSHSKPIQVTVDHVGKLSAHFWQFSSRINSSLVYYVLATRLLMPHFHVQQCFSHGTFSCGVFTPTLDRIYTLTKALFIGNNSSLPWSIISRDSGGNYHYGSSSVVLCYCSLLSARHGPITRSNGHARL